MAEVEENVDVWNRSWDWSQEGEEWSSWWGGSDALWFGALLPRIHAHVPTGTILEIGGGYGRWTNYLKEVSDRLIVVDLAERCIEHCRRRFSKHNHIEFHVNDGRSLEMIPNGSLDFVFSFDSLVHAESDVLGTYLEQLAAKLKPDGVGFVHHSNLGAYAPLTGLARRVPQPALERLIRAGVLIDIISWRAEGVTATAFAKQCARAGLACFSQEKIAWQHGVYLIDALSMFTPRGSTWERPRCVIRNPFFAKEAERMASLYAGHPSPRTSKAEP